MEKLFQQPIKLFISYAHEDQEYLDRLLIQLASMQRKNLIENWSDKAIAAGDKWDDAIKRAIEEASIVLFLVSPHFLASDYIHAVEVQKAIAQSQLDQSVIVPIIIRPCDFEDSDLSDFQALPKGAKAISTYQIADVAWLEVEKGLKQVILYRQTGGDLVNLFNNDSDPPIIPLNANLTLPGLTPEYIRAIRAMIAKGETDRALDILTETLASHNDGRLHNDVIALSARWNGLQDQINKGIINTDNQNLQNNRITNALLSLVDDIT